MVVDGLPELGANSVQEALDILRHDHDQYRTAVINEPRSSPVAVGAYLLPSQVADFGVIFFNPATYLGMCGHGTIGLVETLKYLGLATSGEISLETPAGIVTARALDDGRVSLDNVPAYRYVREVESCGAIGDIAYGGNWFFISSCHRERVAFDNIEALDAYTWEIRRDLAQRGITGADGAEIDHIELTGPSDSADSRNYVHCPGGQYDRSPCGTGTSAKLACLYEEGALREGQTWRQESIIGSVFEGSVRITPQGLIPTITGQAFVNGETTILIDEADPFAWGIR